MQWPRNKLTNKTRPILIQNQMMMPTKALASHYCRSALPLPSKRDPKIPTRKANKSSQTIQFRPRIFRWPQFNPWHGHHQTISRTRLFQRKDHWVSSSKWQLLYHVSRRRFRSNVTLKRLEVHKRHITIRGLPRKPNGTLQRLSHSRVINRVSIWQRIRQLQRHTSYTRRSSLDESLRHRNGQTMIPWMLGGPTTIIPASKCISHEKSMDIQIQNKRTSKPKINQPSIEIRNQKLLWSTRSALLRDLRSSCLLHNVKFALRTHKHSKLSSTTIRRVCCLHSKQARLLPSTSLLWMCRRIRRSTQIRLSCSSPSIRHERQSTRMGSIICKHLHRLRTITPQKRRKRLRKIRQQFKDSNPKCATKPGKYYPCHCSRTPKTMGSIRTVRMLQQY